MIFILSLEKTDLVDTFSSSKVLTETGRMNFYHKLTAHPSLISNNHRKYHLLPPDIR